ncbi:uncharacterized protein LOC126585325 isoform X1 [Malus sylvestris]|uniref:uncharacterized protein LOC126585325 isoform X1 n=1 Tax=Malus sylvestris TaxID=3752 RepID=UPI0021AC2E13|nr:uncharacterized protein LOC126585325 isoform X1 [Malus sylvestris]
MKCTARAGAGAVNLARRTPVRPSSILVVGATETLGRQIVRRALDEGHDVRCLVRPRPTPADFLRDWRATVVNIGKEKLFLYNEVILFVFYSIHNCDKHHEVPLMEIKYCTEKFLQDSCMNHAIIRLSGFMEDVAPLTFIGSRNEKVSGKLVTFAGPRARTTQEVITLCERFAGQEANITRVPVSVLRVTRQLTRLFECTNDVADRLAFLEVDWEGKVTLIQCAKAMGIQKFVFYSIHNCDKHPEVPLMEIKYCTKKFPQVSCINHVIIRLCGFMQGIAYIRREISIGNRCPHKNCIHGHPDVAPLTFIGSRNEKVNGKLVTFAGPHAWTTQEVITLCERFAGQEANITRVPVSVLRVTRQLTRLFECTNDVADRLAFLEVDWEGKVVLIQCAKAMGIQKFVFYSIHNCDKHPEVPLMEIKYCTKRFPQDSCINHVIIRLCGFMQGIAYIRREISIGNRCPHKNCIHGHPDVAPLTFIGSRNEKVNGKLVTFAGPHA